MVTILDGKALAEKLCNSYKKKVEKAGLKIKLAVVLVGDNPASEIYVQNKKKRCMDVGIGCEIRRFKKEISEEMLISEIDALNSDKEIDALMVQMPLPKHINPRNILEAVDTRKDVEGLSTYHMGRLSLGNEDVVPCTPKGVIRLLDEYGIGLAGKDVCIIGYSDIVGKPLATLCLNREATVTVCHVKTKDLGKHTRDADIIMTATGVPKLIKKEMIKQGCIIIDIGIKKLRENVVGDADFESIKGRCSHITPVPGGIGPMTIAMLVENMVEAAERKLKQTE
ncbi:bifunctional 5,10-methylenetetrahydrofolate dehydrogenase/5,10-methenyltetrahydrofolate cyclohydrolase [Candidatus Woesearchaeota archaeon]|nr:bifunctional 5,10-methylenetetrahydrofolate dehydrogenase/5,10-methenyltetrahydrofolate cyclohydrolase [Candidatus Woesearchaeota archaeon]